MTNVNAQLTGRTVLVTGGAGGLGLASARAAGAAGARIAVSDLPGDALESARGQLADEGIDAVAIPADIAEPGACAKLVEAAAGDGPLDGLVACAGITHSRHLGELSRADWDRMIAVNLTAQFELVQAAGRAMAPQGQGAIVCFSSVAGRTGRADTAHYAAAKAAVISLACSAALAWGSDGVRANAICPGVVFTSMWERRIVELDDELGPGGGRRYLDGLESRIALGRLGTPEEIANVVVFLLSDASSYVTGQAINVCGGLEFD